MRPLLLDFLIDAHQAFQLLPETLFLTANLLDRYCSTRVVLKRNYQLIGCASLLIAAKYGERKDRVPMIEELKNMCGSVYDEQMFIQTEWHVLDILEWKIGHPTVYSFLQVALLEGNDEVEVEHMAQYICEVALYHRDFVSTKPSIMARASIALARTILGCHEAFSLNEIEHWTAWQLYQHLDKTSQFLAQKYSSPRLSSSSIRFKIFLAQRSYREGNSSSAYTSCEISQKPSHKFDYENSQSHS